MRYQEWKSDSSRWFKTRSAPLEAVDRAFEQYERVSTRANVVLLGNAIANWKLSKGLNASTRDQSVERLTDWVIEEHYRLGEFWRPEAGWGPTQNCYRYAMCDKAADPSGQNSVPGAYANAAVLGGVNYHQQLIAGVLNDGNIQGVAIVHVQQATLRPLPPQRPGHYLAMMVGNQVGFHWLRRDAQGRWSHKNGGPADPETICMQATTKKYHAMTDNVVLAMTDNATKALWTTGYNGMSFIAHFYVPNGGMRVTRNNPHPPPPPPPLPPH